MNPPPNREVALFGTALELPASQRAAYLDEACADDPTLRLRLQALLRVHEEAISFLEAPPPGTQESILEAEGRGGTARLSSSPVEKAGDRIGRYKLLQQIGEGGCGAVYMAEQEEPVRRRVALKVIKLGMDTKEVIARFEAERQALALMDHPNIAKVLDAGATDTGRPYFVMELVRGIKITDYCDQNNLSTRDRLELFIQVCRAIQHAHQKGVIHRDIKPSNILITVNDGVPVPKVIDFGIAKATGGQTLTDKTLFTAFEQFIGTPAYMSPEQAVMTSLDIDTRSDIYSLGVLLYELLTSRTPFDAKELLAAGLDALRRTILEREPARPSTRLSTMLQGELTTAARHRQIGAPELIHLVRGDLDWIAMKALEKDRTRRYETANGLAVDVRRFLTDEPVVARPPSTLYLLQKLARRNKRAFAAVAAVAAVLVLGALVSTSQAVRARRAEQEQRRLRETAEKETRLIKDMLHSVAPQMARGRDTQLLRDVLDQTARRLNDSEGHPEMEAELRTTLSDVFTELGDYANASAMHQGARMLRQKLSGGDLARPQADWIIRGICLSALLLGGAVTVMITGAIRRRLRLLSFVCAPLSVSLLALMFGVLMLEGHAAVYLLGSSLLGVIPAAAWMVFFQGGNKHRSGDSRCFPVNPWLDALAGVGFLFALVVLLYVVEDWRGRGEWARVKAELAAKGESLDYASFLKPPIPDADNVMAHPYMQRLFIRGSPEAGPPISSPPYSTQVLSPDPFPLEQLRSLSRGQDRPPSIPALTGSAASQEVIPVLQFTQQPLSEVAFDLAKRAGLELALATNDWPWGRFDEPPASHDWKPTLVTRRFTDLTALQALERLADDYLLSPDPARWRDGHVLALAQRPSLQDMLRWYARYNADFAQLEEALARPHSRLYGDPHRPMEISFASYVVIRRSAQTYANLANIHLIAGDAEAAVKDLRWLRRLADATQAHEPPAFVETMIRVAELGLFTQTVEETLGAGLWPESCLEPIQRLCEGTDLLPELSRSMRGGERAAVIEQVRTSAREGRITDLFKISPAGDESPVTRLIISMAPEGWLDQNLANYARLMQLHVGAADTANQNWEMSVLEHGFRSAEEELEGKIRYCRAYYLLPAVAVPNFIKGWRNAARTQAFLDAAFLACALERYRGAHDGYPETLQALVPEFADRLPHGLFSGEPLVYQRTPAGQYRLSSTGWNAKDDWVWRGVPKGKQTAPDPGQVQPKTGKQELNRE